MPRLRDQHAVWTIAAIALAAFFISAALAAPSAAAPLVPCGSSGQPACSSICQVFDLGKNVFDFIVYVSFSLAVLMIAWGGVLMIVPTIGGGESTKMYAKGRGILWKAFMGLVLIMVAWLAIDSLIKLLAGQSIAGGNVAQIGGYGPWNKLRCDVALPLVSKADKEAAGVLQPNFSIDYGASSLRFRMPSQVAWEYITRGTSPASYLRN